MPNEFNKKAIKLNKNQTFSFQPVALVVMYYSNIRKGNPLFGLEFYDTYDRLIL